LWIFASATDDEVCNGGEEEEFLEDKEVEEFLDEDAVGAAEDEASSQPSNF
jgi:hypothetical protein